jgi:hypothetical protein
LICFSINIEGLCLGVYSAPDPFVQENAVKFSSTTLLAVHKLLNLRTPLLWEKALDNHSCVQIGGNTWHVGMGLSISLRDLSYASYNLWKPKGYIPIPTKQNV